ncbi:MAG: undecaprenyl-diphosphatase UppP [Bdellovibrionota bacterium]
MSFLEVLLLSFVEGLTEFIPVSSTGHLILTNAFMKTQATDFTKAFDVIIQFGAILAVVYLYKDKLKWNYQFYLHIALAFIPTAIIGFLLKNKIDQLFESTTVVAVSLIIGGLILIGIDSWFKNRNLQNLNPKSSLLIGLFQSISMIPGVSRSAATIIGGQFVGLSREKATEFSFILAIPTMAAASGYKLWKIRDLLESSQSLNLLLGVLFSFVFAVLAIKFFISIVNKYGFKYFGYYRIILGALVLILTYSGVL